LTDELLGVALPAVEPVAAVVGTPGGS
jgi:hypothetical protein